MEERMGEAFELGEQLTVVGKKLQPGEQAPDFILDSLDPSRAAGRFRRDGTAAQRGEFP
jgi:thioredoxin-dependent peroxiredoxin